MNELALMDQPVADYFVSNIAKWEMIEGNLVRLYCYKRLGLVLELQYTVMIPVARLAEMGRQCLMIASEGHNEITEKTPEVVH